MESAAVRMARMVGVASVTTRMARTTPEAMRATATQRRSGPRTPDRTIRASPETPIMATTASRTVNQVEVRSFHSG